MIDNNRQNKVIQLKKRKSHVSRKMSKKIKKANLAKFCIDPICHEKQKIIYNLEDSYLHFGHKFESFKTIHQELTSEINQKRFKEIMLSKENAQSFLKEQMNTLFLMIQALLALKQQEFEKQIAECQDNKLARQLFEELNKDFYQLNINNLRQQKDGWEGLFKQKQTDELNECKRHIQDKIQELEIDLRAVFAEKLSLKKTREMEAVQLNLEIKKNQITVEQQQQVQYEQRIEYLLQQQLIKTEDDEYFILNKLTPNQQVESQLKLSFTQPDLEKNFQAQVEMIQENIKIITGEAQSLSHKKIENFVINTVNETNDSKKQK